MKSHTPTPETLALFDTAGEWLARRDDAHWHDADEQAFQAWLQADEAHRQAYQRVSRTWQAAAQLRTVQSDKRVPATPVRQRRPGFLHTLFAPGGLRVFAGAAATACIMLAAGGYWYSQHVTFTQILETAASQPGKMTLPDGSTITANRDTQLLVTYYPWRREVQLQRGEAFFDVASTGQTFKVFTDKSEIRVVGTAFNVDTTERALSVTVEHGKVEVRPDRSQDKVVVLTAHDGMVLDRQTQEIAQTTLPQQAIGSWRSGRLVLRNARLDDVAEQISRYRSAPVEVVDRVLSHRKISGVVNTADTDAFLESLAQMIHANITHLQDGRVLIDHR